VFKEEDNVYLVGSGVLARAFTMARKKQSRSAAEEKASVEVGSFSLQKRKAVDTFAYPRAAESKDSKKG